MNDIQPHEMEDQGPYDPDLDYTLVRLDVAYDWVSEGRVDDAITGLRRLQYEVNPNKIKPIENDSRAYMPDYMLVTQAIADILWVTGNSNGARYELMPLFKQSTNHPVTINMLAKMGYSWALSSTSDPFSVVSGLSAGVNYVTTAQDSYADGFAGVDEQTLQECKHETHVVALHLAAEVYERGDQLKHVENYKSLLIASAEIVGRLGGYELAKTFLRRYEEIAPLTKRAYITRAEIEFDLGQMDDAWQSFGLVATAPGAHTDRTYARMKNLKARLIAPAAE